MHSNPRALIVCLLALAAGTPAAFAQAPAVRDQVSLNGTWPVGGAVPQYTGISGLTTRTFERDVAVPSAWSGKIVKLEFEAVNFIAEVSVNGTRVATHVGGWSPFEVDVTSRAPAGSTFRLKVVVKGPKNAPIVNGSGKFVYPVGGWSNKGGIADDVWLRAYGRVHVEDAFVRTSFRQKTLSVQYTVRNADTRSRTVAVQGDARRPGGSVEKSVSSTVTLAAGERRTFTASAGWASPALYSPETPVLYHLETRVLDGTAVVDRETRRFGFREIWIEGNQFRWNGVRANFYGDYQSIGDTWYTQPAIHTPANWRATVGRIKALNIRVLRWHHNPVPRYILDIMDEEGLLACDESPNWARSYLVGTDKTAYVANFKAWCGGWIRKDRNHPSVYIWNATNEMTYGQLGGFSAAQCREMGDAIRVHDATRPVGYDGDASVSDACLNRHYPEGYNKEPAGSIYSWTVHASRPTGSGETMHTKSPDPNVQTAVERNKWWLGIKTRGMRATDWTDVRPACFWFADADLRNPDPKWRQRGINLRNAYAPVALFDRAYDDLGISPYVTNTTPGGTLPSIDEGVHADRTLILYNDAFSNTSVTAQVEIRAGGTTYATGSKTYDVPLGGRLELPYSFQVPYAGGATLEVWLRTRKGGVLTFEEVRRFRIVDRGLSGTSRATVTLGGTGSGAPPTVAITSPSNGSVFSAGSDIPLVATATASSGRTVTRVEFFANGNLIATENIAPWTPVWRQAPAGAHALTAKATDSTGASTTSAAVSISVGASSGSGPLVTGITLIDADTDRPVAGYDPMASGGVINLRTLPTRRLNVRVNTSPSTVGSVRIGLDGNANHTTQNGAPYSLSDNGGDYHAWTPSVGAHVLKATAYTGSNASGAAGPTFTLPFTVVDQDGPVIASITLINADSDGPVAAFDPLHDGAVIDLAALPTRRLNVRVNPYPATVGSVRIGLDGNPNHTTQNGAPYSLSDNGGDYHAWTPSAGVHRLTATPYAGSNASGLAGPSTTFAFTVRDGTSARIAAGDGIGGENADALAADDGGGGGRCGALGLELFAFLLLARLRRIR